VAEKIAKNLKGGVVGLHDDEEDKVDDAEMEELIKTAKAKHVTSKKSGKEEEKQGGGDTLFSRAQHDDQDAIAKRQEKIKAL
jgi:hypothetical protein